MKKTRKNKKGGSNIRYHYTKNENRGEWIEALYPYGLELISKLHTIPWKSYSYEGKTIITDDKEDSITISGTATIPTIPYYIGGGTACELLDIYEPKYNLHEHVDPTADIDIVLSPPIFKPNKELEYDFSTYYLIDKHLSPLAEDYTHWLFDKVCDLIEKFHNGLSFAKFKLPNITLDKAIEYKEVGKCLIARFIHNNQITIQVITQVGENIDHFIEFTLSGDIVMTGDENPKKSEYDLLFKNVYVQNILSLLIGQIKAMKNREDNIHHKFYNHCQRILYLSKIVSKKRDNRYILNLLENNKSIFKKCNKDIYEKILDNLNK